MLNFHFFYIFLSKLLSVHVQSLDHILFVNSQVTEIDDGLLQLKNLKQLTLSANLIKNIDSKRLPKGLEVGSKLVHCR